MKSHRERCAVKSMTGFARLLGSYGGADLEVEIRSVNHRFLEVGFRGPRALAPVERELRAVLQRDHRRGRFDVTLNRRVEGAVDRQSKAPSAYLDGAIAAYAATCKRHGVAAEGMAHFIGELMLREMAETTEVMQVSDAELPTILELVERCSSLLRESREQEGALLATDIEARVVALDAMRGAISRHVEGSPSRLREKMLARLAGVAQEVRLDPERLAMEIALLVDRVDVSEELSRLSIHLTQFSQLMQQGHPDGVGRKLDFMVQEIGRELNTIGSKAQDAQVQGIVVEAKSELEKIREQVQNIE
jgi:uncharacterized protein (TIGR00255 family)